MATSKTNWGAILLLLGIVVIVWYWLKGKPTQAASNGSAVGGASPLSRYPQPLQQGQQGGSMMPISGSGGAIPNLLSGLEHLFGGSKNNYNSLALSTTSTSPTLDALSIPLEPLQTMNDLPSWTANDPNAPWNSIGTDFSTTSDTGSLSIPSDSSFDWGSYSPSDFLVTQSLPGDSTSSVSSDSGGDSYAQDFSSMDYFQSMLDATSLDGAGSSGGSGYLSGSFGY